MMQSVMDGIITNIKEESSSNNSVGDVDWEDSICQLSEREL